MLTGSDAKAFLYRHNLTIHEMSLLTGIQSGQIYDFYDRPKIPPRQSVLLRLINLHPELMPLPKIPEFGEVFELVKAVDPTLGLRDMAVMLGLSDNAGTRLQQNSNTTWPVKWMLYIIQQKLLGDQPIEEKLEFLQMLSSLAQEEKAGI